MAQVQLDLALGLEAFQKQLDTAEGLLRGLKSSTNAQVTLRAYLDTSSLDDQLKAAQKVLSQGNTQIKVATDFYKTGSQYAISATKLKTQIIDPIQQKVAGDRKYTIKIGTELAFDQSSLRQIDAIVAKAKASLEAVQRSTAATRQQLAQLTQTPAQGGLDAAALRKLQSAAGQAGIKSSATGATELRKELRTAFAKASDDAIEGLAKGLIAKSSTVVDASTKTGQALIKALKKSLGIASPSKETGKLGQASADGFGGGFVKGMASWERQMAAAIRQAIGSAFQQGLSRDAAARGALADMGRDAGQLISSSLGKALKQGLASSVAPALKGGLLGATGGLATGGAIGGAGALKGVTTAGLSKLGAGGMAGIAGKLGHLTAGDTSGLTSFLQDALGQVVQAASSTGGHGALLGAAGVAGVAGLGGLAKGAGGSLVSQAVESIKNRILGTAVQQAQAQSQMGGSTAGAITAPVENAANIFSALKSATGTVAQGLLGFAKELTPGALQQRIVDIAWSIDQAAEQFGVLKKDTQVLAGKVRNTWNAFSNNTPAQLLPPQPVAGTGLVRQQNMQLGDVVGRTAVDFPSRGFGRDGGFIGPAESGDLSRGFINQTRSTLQPTMGKPGEWRIVSEVNGVWQRIKTDSEIAAERMAQIRAAITSSQSFTNIVGPRNTRGTGLDGKPLLSNGQAVTSQFNSYTGNVGTFNPFDQAFYRPTQPPQAPPPGGGGNFGANRFGTPSPGGALAMRNVPVEVFTSFKEAERLLAEVERRLAAVAKAFDTLKVKSQIQADQEVRKLAVSLRAVELAFQKGEIGASDLRAASYGAARELAGLGAKSAEVQNLAQAFENLGIQSRAAVEALQDQRNLDLGFIESTLGKDSSEANRAANARDIQQLGRANELVRTAQGASGFGGFRGREIGNDELNKGQQRSTLANAVREMHEYQSTLKLTATNAKTYGRVQAALTAEIKNAERAFAVLNGTASDGERIAHVARNAWGTILDDFKNLVPQLLVFAVAYNLILQRVMTTPAAVIQAAASFDRLETSINSYLSATRGIGDASAQISQLKDIALDLGIGFENAASSYLRFAAATQGTTIEGQEAEITRTLATAGRNLGLNGEQIDRASVALTQMLSKGRVQSEELRQQLAEQMPGALQVAARAFGVTTKELYQMVEAGQIAGDEFVGKFINQLKSEGADVNQLAGTFSNVTEQMGSSIQAFAASAGEPFLQPLTVGLRLLNSLITALIPLSGPLSAMFLAAGSGAAKAALGIKSWGKGIQQAIGVAMGAGQSGLLGPDGNPISSSQTRGRQFKGGLKQAGSGVADIFRSGVQLAAGQGSMKSMADAAEKTGKGLRSAAAATSGLAVGLKAALIPALKFYLIIEGLSLVIKAATGQLSALNTEANRSRALTQKKGEPGQLSFGQKIASRLHVPKNLENIGTYLDAGAVADGSRKANKILKDYSLTYSVAARKILAIETQLFNEKQQLRVAETNEQRESIQERIKKAEEARKEIIDTLPENLTPEKVQTQISDNKAALQAAEEAVKRIDEMGPLAAPGFLDMLRNRVTILEKEGEQLEKNVKVFEQLRRFTSLGSIDAQLKGYQDNLQNEDINTANFENWKNKISGLERAGSDLKLGKQEVSLRTQEMTLRAMTTQLKAQESVHRIKLGLIENERKTIEASLSLEQTRTKLQETLAQRRVDIANAVNAPEEALAAEVELRRVREAGQARELQMQGQLLNKDRERVTIETQLQKDQIKIQTEQLKIDKQMLKIEELKIKEAIKSGKINDELKVEYQEQLKAIASTVDSTNTLIGQQGRLEQAVERMGASEQQRLNIKQQELEVTRQINEESGLTLAQQQQIQAAKQAIANKEAASLATVEQARAVVERETQAIEAQLEAVRSLIAGQQERARATEEAAAAEMGLLDRLLEIQQGRNEGGFFERMAKASLLGASGEQEALDLAKSRMNLQRQIQQEQMRQKQLELNLKKQELQAEAALYALKLKSNRLAHEEAKMKLRSQLEETRLTLETLGPNRSPDQNTLYKGVTNALRDFGYNTEPELNNSTSIKARGLLSQVDLLQQQGVYLDEAERESAAILRDRLSALKAYIVGQERQLEIQQKLFDLDAAQWFGQFLDKSTQLGRTLGVVTDGLSEFRTTVSQAFADAITSGATAADAIADAGQALAGKVVTGLFDEMVLKPMEANLFKGLAQVFGFDQPQSEQAATAANTAATKTAVDGVRQAIERLTGVIQSATQGSDSAMAGVAKPSFDTPTYPAPSNPGIQSTGAATAVGGVANMLPGTRGGPSFNEGVGARAGRHQGQDLGLDVSDPIHARRAGSVRQAYPTGFGKVGGAVVMRYDDGSEGTYGHVNPSVRVGDQVSAGQRIATVTPDVRANGQNNTHLHYELRDGFGQLLNPLNAIRDSLRIPASAVGGETALATTAGLPAAVMSALPMSQQVDSGLGTGQLGESLAGLAGQSEAATSSLITMDESFWKTAGTMSGLSNAAANTPSMFGQLNTSMGTAIQALAGIGMIGGGVGMMSGGGTYNTLMGLAGIFGGIASVTGSISSIGGMFGGGSLTGNPVERNGLGAIGPNFGIPQRAVGGPVRARKPYLVGERGMELFIPSADGAIVPNHKLYAANAAALQENQAMATAGLLEENALALAQGSGGRNSAAGGSAAGGGLFQQNQAAMGAVASGGGLFQQNQAAMGGVARAQQQQQQDIALERAVAVPARMEFNYQSQVINNVEYVTADQFQRGMADAAERGRAMTINTLQNSVRTRKRIAI